MISREGYITYDDVSCIAICPSSKVFYFASRLVSSLMIDNKDKYYYRPVTRLSIDIIGTVRVSVQYLYRKARRGEARRRGAARHFDINYYISTITSDWGIGHGHKNGN